MKTLNFISFFSGAMGLDLGLEKAGFKCLAVNEIEECYCDTIKKNHKNLKIYQDDIRNLSGSKILSDLDISKEEIFLIAGGPPCQAFSSAGRRKGLEDSRGNVFLSFLNLINEISPEMCIIENVRGLLSAKIEVMPELIKGSQFEQYVHLGKEGGVLFLIINMLEDFGYNVNFDLYDTSFFGVPQKRERIVIIGSKNKKVPNMVATTGTEEVPFKTFDDVCGKLRYCTHIMFDKHRIPFLEKIEEGCNWKSLTIEDQKKALGNAFYSGGGKTGFYRRLHSKKPAPTLVTSPRMPATMLCHPKETRPLSIEEYSALQTFPSNYKFCGSIDDIYRQIGNAVPVKFAEEIGLHIKRILTGETLKKYVKTTRYKNTDYDSFLESYKK